MPVVTQRWSGERGAELIELALALPMLLLAAAAIIDFGLLFQRYEVVANAAREGARIGVLPNYDESDVQQRVTDYLTTGGLTDESPPAEVTYSSAELSAGGPVVQLVEVTVVYPSQFLYLGPIAALVSGGAYDTIDLRARSVMRRETALAMP